MGQVTGCVLQDSRALVKDTHWPGPDLEVAATLSPIPASATYIACCLQDLPLPDCLGGLRSLRALWVLGTWFPQ